MFACLMQYFRSEELKQELNDADNLTEERLDELLDTFLRDFEAGAPALGARGWPDEFASYKVAKAAVNAYSRIMARRHPELRVNCAHPGYVRTDMTRNSGLLTPEEGASNVVKVAAWRCSPPVGRPAPSSRWGRRRRSSDGEQRHWPLHARLCLVRIKITIAPLFNSINILSTFPSPILEKRCNEFCNF